MSTWINTPAPKKKKKKKKTWTPPPPSKKKKKNSMFNIEHFVVYCTPQQSKPKQIDIFFTCFSIPNCIWLLYCGNESDYEINIVWTNPQILHYLAHVHLDRTYTMLSFTIYDLHVLMLCYIFTQGCVCKCILIWNCLQKTFCSLEGRQILLVWSQLYLFIFICLCNNSL